MKKLKILAIICALVMATNVHAALQSRPGIDAKKGLSISDYFMRIREMEAKEGALGLNATFAKNTTTQEYEETSVSNNIDIHMCKNTEWGAVAMLSDSNYGAKHANITSQNSNKIYDVSASTTGNITGIFGINGGIAKTEYVAAGIVEKMWDNTTEYLKNSSARYVNSYENGTDKLDYTRYLFGDATYETICFVDTPCYFVNSGGGAVFARGGNSIYGFHCGSGYAGDYPIEVSNCIYSQVGSRACVWVGEGI